MLTLELYSKNFFQPPRCFFHWSSLFQKVSSGVLDFCYSFYVLPKLYLSRAKHQRRSSIEYGHFVKSKLIASFTRIKLIPPCVCYRFVVNTIIIYHHRSSFVRTFEFRLERREIKRKFARLICSWNSMGQFESVLFYVKRVEGLVTKTIPIRVCLFPRKQNSTLRCAG